MTGDRTFYCLPGNIGLIFSTGISQLDSLLHDRTWLNLMLTLSYIPGMVEVGMVSIVVYVNFEIQQ